MKTPLLDSLYNLYNIDSLPYGVINDKLGDVYESYCVAILKDASILNKIKSLKTPTQSLSIEETILVSILNKYGITDFSSIKSIDATTDIPPLPSGGNPKTDICATISYNNGNTQEITISCKQSTVTNIALAEFDVKTICNGVGITDSRLKQLLIKHQTDASAKNFTKNEKDELKSLISPYSRMFVRWVVTGSKDINSNSIQVPKIIVIFKLSHPTDKYNINVGNGDYELKSFIVLSSEEYIDHIMLTDKGKPKSGGFGTGLSWTYATGSKGKKIQFKGKV